MNLREYIFSKRISVSDLAKHLNVSRKYIYLWFTGSNMPSQEILNRISSFTKGKIHSFEQLLDKRKNDK